MVFQSTPSQRGRPAFYRILNFLVDISIHALAKRATSHYTTTVRAICISIHALAKRATIAVNMVVTIFSIFQSTPSQRGRRRPYWHCVRRRKFQSTPSQRGRQKSWNNYTFRLYISIHALAKRATNGILLTPTEHRYFNPRPRKEGDM